jgi:hypothetical protein
LLAEIKPRWTPERHERVFAAIIERIRAEAEEEDARDDEHDRDHDRPGAGGAGYGQYEGGHTHA